MTGSLPIRLTAAATSHDHLCIATLSWNGKQLYLVPSLTQFFVLGSEDQAGVRDFGRELWDYFGKVQIEELLVRRGATEGPKRTTSAATRIETILQLMPFTCAHVRAQRVSYWAADQNWLLPLSQRGLLARKRKLQELAIQTAAFGIACVLNHRAEQGSPNGPTDRGNHQISAKASRSRASSIYPSTARTIQ